MPPELFPGDLVRVLLVEDDAMIGESVAAGLRLAGHTVDWVQDGRAAEAALAAGVHEIVLLDLGLPRKLGLDVLRGLRAGGADLPVLIITARDAVADRIAGTRCRRRRLHRETL